MEFFPEKRRFKDSFIDYNVGVFSNSGLNESFSGFSDDLDVDYKGGFFSGKGIKAEKSELSESYSEFSGGLNDPCIDYNVGLFGSGDGSSRVGNTELSKLFPRLYGGFDTNKRYEDMLNQSSRDDMGSGIREDFALKACVKSESQQMSQKSKRKVLIKEDPDWSPCREDIVSEGWTPERKRERRSLVWKYGDVDVSRPTIQALPAVRMFETFWNRGGKKNKTEIRANYLSSKMAERSAMIKVRGYNDSHMDSIEEEDDFGVLEPPVIALPAPCSFRDFCTSAGWKVTLSEGGTTMYCSPTGGIYDSPSKVLEALSQQASESKNSQSASFQPVDNSKPIDDGAVQIDENLGEIEKSIQSRKKSLVDKFVRRMDSLNNEKSSSESGSGVTSTGDCESELQGLRRSTRIKGRHVAVDFEFDTERFVSEDGLSSSDFRELKNSSCKAEKHDKENV